MIGTQSLQNTLLGLPGSIAIVSGKGGSGKTMVTATISKVLDKLDIKTVTLDTDVATGGMTYYLGLKVVGNLGVGLSEIAVAQIERPVLSLPVGAVQELEGYRHAQFVGIGDHRRLYKERSRVDVKEAIRTTIRLLKEGYQDRILIVDCRGGIDDESLAVCEEVEDIIIVVEPDTTSYQATQHLVEVLSLNSLTHKLKGFIINKVFDDPTAVARNGTGAFKCRYLGSIPLDIGTARDFFVGEVPSTLSHFGIHVWGALQKAYKGIDPPPGRVLVAEEFRELSLNNSTESVTGGMLIASLIITFAITYIVGYRSVSDLWMLRPSSIILLLSILGIFGSIEPTRRLVGKAMTAYARVGRILVMALSKKKIDVNRLDS